MSGPPPDLWEAGGAHERVMGRWSRRVAAEFTAWLDGGPGLRWLDVGCGTGALTAAVPARCRPRAVVGLDRSAGFVAAARTAAAGADTPGADAPGVASRPPRPDGSVPLAARAWAVRGRRL